jgi:hypothetical protein
MEPVAVPETPPKARPAKAQMPSNAKPSAMTIIVCMSNPLPLTRLSDVQTFDLARWGKLESEVGPKITPLVRVKSPDQTQAIVLDVID